MFLSFYTIIICLLIITIPIVGNIYYSFLVVLLSMILGVMVIKYERL